MTMKITNLENKQDKWATDLFIKDGCPVHEADQLTYKDVVDHLYDGNEEAAWDDFIFSMIKDEKSF
ncbi:MAG: hypothetical protein GF364_19245 [Candidatus Lokiarchaeota archaeon]|nr:hypothetical protein [Candidatus Lokiarchaeota archaeon]